MLRHVRDLQHYTVHGIDGELGRVREFYFEDQGWTVRHIVVTTGHWPPRHSVLLPTLCVARIDDGCREVCLTLTGDQVASSPSIDTEKPVSRQHEGKLYWYYGFTGEALPPDLRKGGGDPHLRRTREVVGYAVHRDHEHIGAVDDFLVDDGSWSICYMVVDVHTWWLHRKVLVLPRSVVGITWGGSAVHVDVSRAILRQAPEYNPNRPIDRDYEARLRDYYDQLQGQRHGLEPREGPRSETGSRSAAA